MNHKPFVTTELNPLPDAVQVLIAERDEWQARCEFSFEQRDKLHAQIETLQYEVDAIPAIKAERDEYAACADTMAAAHKVERDELNAQMSNALGQISHLDREIAGWKADQKENMKNQCELVGQLQQALVERDALKDAARMALDALVDLKGIRMNEVEHLSMLHVIAALTAVL